jgi:hypothetical protein
MSAHRVRSTFGRSRALTLAVLATCALVGAAWIAYGILDTLHAAGQAAQSQARPTPAAATIEGPFTHANLSIYVVRGGAGDRRAYMTLDQGLAAGTATVHEKGGGAGQDQSAVNTVEIENKSDRWLFLQAGDIVKGGKQDRTIMTDMLLPPKSKPQSIDAFCVEHGRWTPSRDGLAFKANPGIVAGTSLKRAIQSEKSQSRVWQEVARADAMAAAMVAPTAGAIKPESLSSTGTYNAIAENTTVNTNRAAYVAALQPQLRRFKDAVGLAVAINGRMTAADVYSSPALFDALSGKLLESYALEAVLARATASSAVTPPSTQQASAFLATTGSAPAATETIGDSMHRRTRETKDVVMYEYAHVAAVTDRRDAVVLHKSYLKK